MDNIYTTLDVGLSILVKELAVATRVMQSSSNELSTSGSDSVKCKQTEVNTYTLNSWACVESVPGCEVCYRDDVSYMGFESILKRLTCLAIYIYIYIYIYILKTVTDSY